jgi:hypothetical protein
MKSLKSFIFGGVLALCAMSAFATHTYFAMGPMSDVHGLGGGNKVIHTYVAPSIAGAAILLPSDTAFGVTSISGGNARGAAALYSLDFNSRRPQNVALPVRAESLICTFFGTRTGSTTDSVTAGIEYKMFDSTGAQATSVVFKTAWTGSVGILRVSAPLPAGAQYWPWILPFTATDSSYLFKTICFDNK